MKQRKNSKLNSGWGLLQLGIVIGAVFVVSTALVYEIYLGADLWTDFKTYSTSMLAMLIALVSLIISYRMFTEQQLIRQAGTDPVVIAHLDQREDAGEMIVLKISNVGAGPALNISLKVDGLHDGNYDGRLLTVPTDWTEPVKVIKQDAFIQFNLGMGFRLLEHPMIPAFSVNLTYDDLNGETHKDSIDVDVKELSRRAAHTPLAARIARSLESIAKAQSGHEKREKQLLGEIQTIRDAVVNIAKLNQPSNIQKDKN